MGRPPIADPKDVRKQVFMTAAQAALLESAARAAGEPLSVYLVTAGLQRAVR